jgi:DNA-binding GntR family transcriptional regulator
MNAAERAYRTLRSQAIQFDLKPGERLLEVDLARRMRMSRAPVREAMNRLVAEGLLDFVPNHGFSCRKLSATEITQLYQVRADLEAGGIVELMGRANRAALEVLAHSCKDAIARFETLSVEEFVAHDEDFHLQLAAMGGNKERVRMLEHINARIQFVRRINWEGNRRQTSLGEHGEIMNHLLAGNVERVVTTLRRHLTLTVDEVKNTIREELTRMYVI